MMKYRISFLLAGVLLATCTPQPAVETSYEIEASGGTITLSDAASVNTSAKYSWISFSQSSTTLTISANNTYDVRTASIEYTTRRGGQGTAHITQKQLDAILLSANSFAANPFGDSFTFKVSSNVDFSYNVEGGDWLKVSPPSKGLSNYEYSITVSENDTDKDRLGKILFKQGRLTETLVINQRAKPEVLKNTIPGMYMSSSKRQYASGKDQIVQMYDGNNLCFVLSNPPEMDQLEVTGYTSEMKTGDSAKISVAWNKNSSSVVSTSYVMTVFHEEDGLVWLADDAGNGVIIKK